MPTYTIDPNLFQADGAVVNWDSDAKRLGVPVDPNRPFGTVIQLRWMLKADIVGMPTEPFFVWSRPHSASAGFKPLAFVQQQRAAWPRTQMMVDHRRSHVV